jgi:hypothetical protein
LKLLLDLVSRNNGGVLEDRRHAASHARSYIKKPLRRAVITNSFTRRYQQDWLSEKRSQLIICGRKTRDFNII